MKLNLVLISKNFVEPLGMTHPIVRANRPILEVVSRKIKHARQMKQKRSYDNNNAFLIVQFFASKALLLTFVSLNSYKNTYQFIKV